MFQTKLYDISFGKFPSMVKNGQFDPPAVAQLPLFIAILYASYIELSETANILNCRPR